MAKKVVVIGSGPSGWATAQRLVEFGIEVDVISPDVNEHDEVGIDSSNSSAEINTKLFKGSDFPYRDFPYGPKTERIGVSTYSSFSRSGLSLVWGATMLPYSKIELSTWPVDLEGLYSGYGWVTSNIPISGREDSLQEEFKDYISSPPLIPTSRIRRLLDKGQNLNDPEFIIASPRLAVQTSQYAKSGCNYCGLCLTGCPKNYIWNAPSINNDRLKYISGFRVIDIVKDHSSFSIRAISKQGLTQDFEGYERVFVAAAPIESFRILATSKMVSSIVKLKDSQTFFVPLLLSPQYGSVEKSSYSLSQAFALIKQDKNFLSHLQIYEFSEDYITRVYQIFPFLRIIPKNIISIVLRRMFVGIGYLHSDDSFEMLMKLESDGAVSVSNHHLRELKTRKRVINIVSTYSEKLRKLGVFPVKFLTQISPPGGGVHFGGWLPMGTLSDSLGQPFGQFGVHVVDSSVFSSIPPGPITFTIMANAVRIVEEIYG